MTLNKNQYLVLETIFKASGVDRIRPDGGIDNVSIFQNTNIETEELSSILNFLKDQQFIRTINSPENHNDRIYVIHNLGISLVTRKIQRDMDVSY